MPYEFETKKICLTEAQDRRVKLSSEDKDVIRDEYATGFFSLNDLAKKYKVSKKTILLIVNPNSKAKMMSISKNIGRNSNNQKRITLRL